MKKFTLLAILLVVGFSGIARNTSQTSPMSPVLADTSAPTTPTNRTAEDVSSAVVSGVTQVQTATGVFGVGKNAEATIPAFPGAEGVGADTVGGRGGKVIKVTNLNDSGLGSLREAVTSSGPRIVVFDVSGNINLTSILTVNTPYLTIAGQTSPGGISVSGKQFNIATHDVIIRHMRFRSGGHEYTGDNSDGDSFSLWGQNWGGNPVYNIIIDHCSITWGVDETFSVTGGATRTTIQRCLIGEGLKYAKHSTSDHSKGLMISGKYNYDTEVSLYRNYIAHVSDRAPLLYNPPDADHSTVPTYIVEGTNNVCYNWNGGSRPGNGGNAPVNWTNNYTEEGLDSNRQDFIFEYANRLSTPEPMIYLKGNIGTGRSESDPEWRVSEDWHAILLSEDWRKSTPWPISKSMPSETMTYSLAQKIVLESGATVPIRDSVDERIVNSFADGTGRIPDNVSYPADWPTYSNITPPADTDSDGMADLWETVRGLDTSINDSAGDDDDDGYTNIEEYLHWLAAGGNFDPLTLHAAPADQTLHLSWTLDATLPVTSTWRIDYASATSSAYLPVSGIVSPTRVYTLTGLTNYIPYTVTLNAMLDGSPILTDTATAMPTDIFVYLPLILK